MVPGLQHRRFASFDGTEIACRVRGEGPAIVLVDGLGGTPVEYPHLVREALADFLASLPDHAAPVARRA